MKALRCLNMSISSNLLRKWFDHVKTNLECSKRERLEFEYSHREAPIFIPFILPHEFIFLLCNSLNRIDTVKREHKLKFDCQRGDIYQWEIADGKPMREMQRNNQMRRIHLLEKDAFENKGPKNLIQTVLNDEAAMKRISYIGAKPKIKAPEDKKQTREVD